MLGRLSAVCSVGNEEHVLALFPTQGMLLELLTHFFDSFFGVGTATRAC